MAQSSIKVKGKIVKIDPKNPNVLKDPQPEDPPSNNPPGDKK